MDEASDGEPIVRCRSDAACGLVILDICLRIEHYGSGRLEEERHAGTGVLDRIAGQPSDMVDRLFCSSREL